ncbi:FtsK/SpoIIIE N-terminal domain-containing protein [Terrilactibacillus sp. S3-3]|nr:FtsK/SpoIIIE N-terminal domain-containing protein [Terrilactibacillus sp. S3-3]
MEKLWLFTDEHYQLIDLHPFHNEDVTIGSRLKDTFTIPFQLDVELVLKWSYSQKR